VEHATHAFAVTTAAFAAIAILAAAMPAKRPAPCDGTPTKPGFALATAGDLLSGRPPRRHGRLPGRSIGDTRLRAVPALTCPGSYLPPRSVVTNLMCNSDRVAANHRTRLPVDVRRRQLLRVGTELLAEHPYDAVWIDEVARRAGVSRRLLYHYFPDKRAFFKAVIEHEGSKLAAATRPDPSLRPRERLRATLDAYLDYVEANEHGYRAVQRGALSADPEIRTIVDRNLERQGERVLDTLASDDDASAGLRIAVRAWLAFVICACLEWLEQRRIDRDSLRDLCIETLAGAVAAADRIVYAASASNNAAPLN